MSTQETTVADGDVPVGRIPAAEEDRRARLRLSGEGWTLTCPWRRPLHGTWAEPWALDRAVPRLDHVHLLTVDADPSGPATDPQTSAALASLATRAIARGTFVVGDLPTFVSRRVPAEVPMSAHGGPGDLAFDLAAVRQRRQVLARRLPVRGPSVSILLATHRPHQLEDVARMIRAQTHRPLEVVLALHGADAGSVTLPDLGDVPVRVVEAPSGRSLGHALSLATEAAGGELVTKMDDDDCYGPDHVRDLVLAREVSGATVVGKSSTVVHLEALDTTVRRVLGAPESMTHRVAGGTLLLGREELASLGGWADVPRAVDSTLLTTVRQAGGSIYRPHDIGYLYIRHRDGHTWSTDPGHFLAQVREQWLGRLSHPAFGT